MDEQEGGPRPIVVPSGQRDAGGDGGGRAEVGEHPDAIFALLGVTAVGWVPE